jgi:EmrB/QacA subfamily drug resistance transporter
MAATPVSSSGREVRDKLRASPWLVLVLVAFGEFMVVLDATIVNVALPSIQKDLGFSDPDLQWVVNGYTLLFGGFLMLGGRAADLFGRRRMFLTGMTLFTVASIANVLATSPEVLVAGRALQGLGAAFVSPAALSIITSTFPSGPDGTKALSIWAGVAAGGAGVGLLLGGILTDALSWEWVFLINVPVGIGTFAAALRYVPESRVVERRGFDPWGAITVTAGLLLLVYAIVKAEEHGWGSTRTLVVGAAAATLLALFVLIETRLREPLIRLGIFRIRSLAAANATAILTSAAMFPLFFFGSLYMQDVKGFSPIESGTGFLPFTAAVILGAGLAVVPRTLRH